MAGEAPRLVPIPQPYRVLDDAEMRAAFGACSEDSELWIAVNQILREYIIEAGYAVGDPVTAEKHGALAHAAGGYEWLGKYQAKLQKWFDVTHESVDVEKGLLGANSLA